MWIPRNIDTYIRLIAMDSGPVNIQELGIIRSQGHNNPVPQEGFFTAQMNALVQGGVKKHIGFQIKDNGWSQWTLYEVRLEIDFER